MKLSEYLSSQKVSPADFAKRLEAATEGAVKVTGEAVRLWVEGERRPRPTAMTAITVATGGLVRANDFYEAA
jgi:hypothetical protein